MSLELWTSAIGLTGVALHSVLADKAFTGTAVNIQAPLVPGCIAHPVARSPTLQPLLAIVGRSVSPGAVGGLLLVHHLEPLLVLAVVLVLGFSGRVVWSGTVAPRCQQRLL